MCRNRDNYCFCNLTAFVHKTQCFKQITMTAFQQMWRYVHALNNWRYMCIAKQDKLELFPWLQTTLYDNLWCQTNTWPAMPYQGTSFVSISRPSVGQVSADQTPESIDLLQMVPETGRVHTYPETGRVHTYPETGRVHTYPETGRVDTYPETGRVHTYSEDPTRSADYDTPPQHGRAYYLVRYILSICIQNTMTSWLQKRKIDFLHISCWSFLTHNVIWKIVLL